MRHHAFWSLFCIFFFTSIGMFSISVQVVTYLVEVGFPPLQAATAWGFSGVLLLFGMLTVSWLDGLLGRRRAILLELQSHRRRHPDAVVARAAIRTSGCSADS